MKISIISIGPIQETYLREGIALYEKRLRHYIPFELIWLKEPRNIKNQAAAVQKENEGRLLLEALEKVDCPVLLDVGGTQLDSSGFSRYIQRTMNRGIRHLGFVIGGPFGFSPELYRAVPDKISVSAMTLSHQLIRLVFMEQLYRAFTILRGEPYHHA